eukprot:6299373-Prymnesium_polylepis.1
MWQRSGDRRSRLERAAPTAHRGVSREARQYCEHVSREQRPAVQGSDAAGQHGAGNRQPVARELSAAGALDLVLLPVVEHVVLWLAHRLSDRRQRTAGARLVLK